MKIFVTGGTGFIGSHFLNQAMKKGHKVIALRREKSIPRVELLKQPEWLYGKLDDNFDSKVFEGVDVFVHLAAHSPNTPYDNLENCLYWNLTAPLKLFNQALQAGVKKYLIAGSCFEYGRSGERYEFIPPDAPLEPTMTYPVSKAAASVAFSGWCSMEQVQMKILRIFQVYGEGEAENRLWPSLKKAAEEGKDFPMTKGEQIRDFIHVKDVANDFIKGLSFEMVKPGISFIDNIGTGNPSSIMEFADHWWRKFNASGRLLKGAEPYRKDEVMRFVPLIKAKG